MKSIKFWISFLSAFWKKFKGLVFLSSILGIIAFLLVPRVEPLLTNFSDGERIGIVGRYGIDEIPSGIQNQISLGLTSLDESDNTVSGLASSWEVQDSGKVWIFKLGNHKWQDGTKVVAKDINYKFSDASSEVVDEQTIKFVLKDPFSPFPTVVSRPIFKRGLLGAGDWKVEKFTFFSNSHYLNSLKLKKIKSQEIQTYKFYLTENDARTALKLGEVDKLIDIVDPKDFSAWKNIKVEPGVRLDRYVGIFINTEDPILSDKSVRQALAYAIDKSAFSEERAVSPVSPKSWAYNPQVKQYNYNPDRAKELLSSIPKEQRANLTIKLVTTPTLLNMADKIKNYWDAIGIKTQIQVSNTPPSDFQTLLAIQTIPTDPDQYVFWHSTQLNTNITHYGKGVADQKPKESQRIDKLLEDGRRTLDQEERKVIYQDFQRFLVEDSPVIILFHPTTYVIGKK